MVKEISYKPMISFRSAFRGFLAGSFIALSLMNDWTLFGQGAVFILGVLILLDTFMPHGTQPYIVTSIITAVIGLAVGAAMSLYLLGVSYLILVFILGIVSYLDRLLQILRR